MKNAIRTTALSLSAAISLVGCAMNSQKNSAQNYELVSEMYSARQRENAAQSNDDKRSAAERIAAENRTSQEAVYITPLSEYKDDWMQERAEGSDFSDAYTRLLILSRVNGHGDDNGIASSGASKLLSYDGRHWISRVLVERNYSINLTALRLGDRKSTRLNSSHLDLSRMPSSA